MRRPRTPRSSQLDNSREDYGCSPRSQASGPTRPHDRSSSMPSDSDGAPRYTQRSLELALNYAIRGSSQASTRSEAISGWRSPTPSRSYDVSGRSLSSRPQSPYSAQYPSPSLSLLRSRASSPWESYSRSPNPPPRARSRRTATPVLHASAPAPQVPSKAIHNDHPSSILVGNDEILKATTDMLKHANKILREKWEARTWFAVANWASGVVFIWGAREELYGRFEADKTVSKCIVLIFNRMSSMFGASQLPRYKYSSTDDVHLAVGGKVLKENMSKARKAFRKSTSGVEYGSTPTSEDRGAQALERLLDEIFQFPPRKHPRRSRRKN